MSSQGVSWWLFFRSRLINIMANPNTTPISDEIMIIETQDMPPSPLCTNHSRQANNTEMYSAQNVKTKREVA